MLPTIGMPGAYFTNPMSYYSTLPVFNSSVCPPYNPPTMPQYLPVAFQYPVLPPIPPIHQRSVYDSDANESSSEVDEESPPPPAHTSEELNIATEDVCNTFVDSVVSNLAMEVVCGCIEEIVKSYLKQSKLLVDPPRAMIDPPRAKIDPPRPQMRMTNDAVPAQVEQSVGRVPSSNSAERALLHHPAKPAANQRHLSLPKAARQPAIDSARFAVKHLDISQFDSEAELCNHIITQMVDHLVFMHLLDMAMDGGAEALVRVACDGLLCDLIMSELMSRSI